MGSNWNRIVLGAAVGAFLLLGTPQAAKADHDRNCSNRINREINKLERDVRRHGFFSRQAQNRRAKISRLQSQCGFAGRRGRGVVFDRRDNRRGPIIIFGSRDSGHRHFRGCGHDRGRGRRW